MTSAKFILEHFYYGQLIQQGQPKGEARLLAASTGISPSLAQQAVERVILPPQIDSDKGSWALVRGKQRKMPFLLIQAQQGSAGQTTSHYIVVQPEVLKSLAGNLTALFTLIEDKLPVFDQIGKMPPVLELPNSGALLVDDQIDDILELMTVAKNRIPVIEPMLGAIVQGVQLIIQDAPVELRERVAFIRGLLALLPSSARFGVTFTTHSLPSTEIDTQIRFMASGDKVPDDVVMFNWIQGKTTGVDVSDGYSHFVMSQLRLDAELVIRRNDDMTAIAGWRINQGDVLSEALSYASLRLKVDESLRTSMPVSKDEVAKILQNDPTLSEDLQILYADHLIKFCLAMKDMSHAAPIAELVATRSSLEENILKQMESAVQDGLGGLIYDTLNKWLENPNGPHGARWVDLAHRSVLSYLTRLVEEMDVDGVLDLLENIQFSDPAVNIEKIIPQIIDISRPMYTGASEIVENLFLLATKYLSAADFTRLLNSLQFRNHLSSPVKRIWSLITTDASHNAPSEALVKMTRSFGSDWGPVVLLRFVELACRDDKFDLVDAPTLDELYNLARRHDVGVYRKRLLQVVNDVGGKSLSTLEQPGPMRLLQIYLILGNYDDLAQQMIRHSSQIYPGDLQPEYLKMINKLFGETPIPPARIAHALQVINRSGVKGVPFIVATIGAIAHHSSVSELDKIADQISHQLLASSSVLSVIPPDTVLSLLKYYARRKHVAGAVKVASIIPEAANYLGNSGVKMIAAAYKYLDWSDELQADRASMLSEYVRICPIESSKKVVAYFGKEFDVEIRRPLEVTYMIKHIFGDMDLLTFASEVRTANDFLRDAVALYPDGKNGPALNDLKDSLKGLSNQFSKGVQQRYAANMLIIGKTIADLGTQYQNGREKDEDQYIEALLKQEIASQSIIDIYWSISGYLGPSRRSKIKTTKIHHVFEGRSIDDLIDEMEAAYRILTFVVKAFPIEKPVKLGIAELHHELSVLSAALPVNKRNDILQALAIELQQFAMLITKITEHGDTKAVEDSSLGKKIDSGKHKPRNVLEFIRFIHGYYK